MGPSSQENGQYNLLNSSSQFATGLGQNNLTLSSQFFSNLLTNPMKALAPEVSAGQKQVQEQNKTNAEFGTRSGGTAAAGQAADSTARGDIINLMGKAQTGAASSLASTGSNLLSAGMSGQEAGFDEAKTMQGQRASQWSDLISSIASTAGGVVAGLPGSPGGTQDVLSNMLGGAS
jgi:hypothetical protein